jgi:hypothetical protein
LPCYTSENIKHHMRDTACQPCTACFCLPDFTDFSLECPFPSSPKQATLGREQTSLLALTHSPPPPSSTEMCSSFHDSRIQLLQTSSRDALALTEGSVCKRAVSAFTDFDKRDFGFRKKPLNISSQTQLVRTIHFTRINNAMHD